MSLRSPFIIFAKSKDKIEYRNESKNTCSHYLFCLTVSAIGLPLILISTPSIHQHFEPENIAISFVENLSNANFQEAKKLSTPESAETLYLFETLVGNQSDELKNTPTHFNISYSEMNTSQDTLFVQGKLFFSHKHKLIRKINLTLVNRRGNWLVDCRDNNIF